MSKPVVNVAIAILFNQSKVLVGWREAKQHQGNKYEFPGGKVEQDESPEQACTREIFEEVGITIQKWHKFDEIKHEYDDIHVHLYLFHAFVTEQQLVEIKHPWAWYERSVLKSLNFPKANDAIIDRLNWKHLIKISSDFNDIQCLDEKSYLYLRFDADLENADKAQQIATINALNDLQLNQLIVNIDVWKKLVPKVQQAISAIHYKHSQLMQLQQSDLILGKRSLAACHDALSLKQAQFLGFDAAILSPVLKTATHLDASYLGWSEFEQLSKLTDLPIFALGGLKPSDLPEARSKGAYGVAGISQF